MKRILIVLIAFHLSLPLLAADTKDGPLYFPPADGEWAKVDPVKLGWDTAKLQEALDFAG